MKKKKNRSFILKKIKENNAFLLLSLLFVFLIFYRGNGDKIIYRNFNYLYAVVFVIIFLISSFVFYFNRRKILIKEYYLIKILVVAFFSYIVSLMFMFFINKYNLEISKNNSLESYKFKITGIARRRMSRGFYFKWDEQQVFIKGFKKIFNKIEEKNTNLEDFNVLVDLKKGICNSYIIEEIEIVELTPARARL